MKTLNYFNADILCSTDKLWLHGCNAQGKFASGIAGLFRKKFPYSYTGYIEKYANNGLNLGEVIFTFGTEGQPIIANCITQKFYGYDGKRYVSYEAIEQSVNTVIQYAVKNNINSVTLPKIGAGLGGGDWVLIEKILLNINDIYSDININVYSL